MTIRVINNQMSGQIAGTLQEMGLAVGCRQNWVDYIGGEAGAGCETANRQESNSVSDFARYGA
jgi:hypothetical protein